MDFFELMERMRAYRRPVLIGIVVLSIATAGLFIITNRSLEIGKFFAAETVTPSPKVNPHAYCDFATKTCLTKNALDWNAPQCGSGSSCIPGQCRFWQGSSQSTWVPVGFPDGLPACEPLSRIDWPPEWVNERESGDPIINPPTAFPDCFVWNAANTDHFNWSMGGTFQNNVNQVLQAGQTELRATGYAVNNCPWTVHLLFSGGGSLRAGFAPGGRDINVDAAFDRKLPGGSQDFPSCWNAATPELRAKCRGPYEIDFKINTYTCGSVEGTGAWRHYVTGSGGGAAVGNIDSGGFTGVFNYGRDCTGAISERAPGTTPTTGPTTSTVSGAHAPSVLQVQCGATQNVLTWSMPTNHDSNAILRSTDGGPAVFIDDQFISFNALTWTDRNVQPDHTYVYRHKAFADQVSNTVTCSGVSTSSTISPTSSPQTTSVTSGSPLPTVSIIPTTTAIGTNPSPSASAPRTPLPGAATSGAPTSGTTASGVSTGPGEATLLAFIVAAVAALGYVSYTHSPTARKREAEAISTDQSPLDFRS